MRHRLEYAVVWPLYRILNLLPQPISRAVGIAIARLVYLCHGRLRGVGLRNLELAFPDKPASERRKILIGAFETLGRQLADFCRLPHYTAENVSDLAVYDGLENYKCAQARGKGVLFVTAHFGGWELGSFVHSANGYPIAIVVRGLDNPYVDRLVTRIRTLHGNSIFDKSVFARGLLAAMRKGETVGVLMDTNMTPPQGVFVDFFGTPACTASGVARVALRTDAAALPAFTIWDKQLRKYRVRFEPALPLIRTGDTERDVIENTARFTKSIEDLVRRYPEQWLWVHRRWKTRPPGEPPIY